MLAIQESITIEQFDIGRFFFSFSFYYLLQMLGNNNNKIILNIDWKWQCEIKLHCRRTNEHTHTYKRTCEGWNWFVRVLFIFAKPRGKFVLWTQSFNCIESQTNSNNNNSRKKRKKYWREKKNMQRLIDAKILFQNVAYVILYLFH